MIKLPWRIGGEVSSAWSEWDKIGVCFVVVDRRLLRFDAPVWISICFVVMDRHLGRSLIGVWFALWSVFGSFFLWLALTFVRWVLSFCGSLSLLRVWGKCLKVKWFCKMIFRSNEANFGQKEIIFRKFYFP